MDMTSSYHVKSDISLNDNANDVGVKTYPCWRRILTTNLTPGMPPSANNPIISGLSSISSGAPVAGGASVSRFHRRAGTSANLELSGDAS